MSTGQQENLEAILGQSAFAGSDVSEQRRLLREAYTELERRHTHGKIVLRP